MYQLIVFGTLAQVSTRWSKDFTTARGFDIFAFGVIVVGGGGVGKTSEVRVRHFSGQRVFRKIKHCQVDAIQFTCQKSLIMMTHGEMM